MAGPSPFHCPDFPEDFLQHARDTTRRKTAPHHLAQRCRLALLLHRHHDLCHDEAGQRVGLSGRQVQRWRQRWASGDFSVTDLLGRGRKADFSPLGPGRRQGHRL